MSGVKIATIALLVFLFHSHSFSNPRERVFSISIGPTWPSALRSGESSTAWNASVSRGMVFDRKVSVGAQADFLWNQVIEEIVLSQGTSIAQRQQRTFMFPLSAYLSLSPVPDMMISPTLLTSVGFNTMYYSRKDRGDEEEGGEQDDVIKNEKGFYMGVMWRIGSEAVVKLSDNTSVLTGLFYNITKLNKIQKSEGDSRLRRRNMNGLAILAGLRVYY